MVLALKIVGGVVLYFVVALGVCYLVMLPHHMEHVRRGEFRR